jgi:hypothetical protein
MRLFGLDVQIDTKELVGFVRDISVLDGGWTETSVQAPSEIKNFPQDLLAPNLFYSGCYEDGWVASDSTYLLHAKKKSTLTIKGFMPNFRGEMVANTVDAFVNNRHVVHTTIPTGSFSITTQVLGQSGSAKLELRFSKQLRLGPADPRPASVLLSHVGFS